MSAPAQGSSSRRKLVAVWLVLAALVVAIVLIERHDRAPSKVPEAGRDERLLIPVAMEELGAIEIAHNGTLHRFERDASGAWFYHGVHAPATQQHAHNADPATAAHIEKSLAGLGRARMERQFPLNVQADEFGVTRPEMFIMVYRPGEMQPLSRYAVGTVAPDKVSRYVLPVGSSWVVTIADYQIDNLLALIQYVSGNSATGLKMEKMPGSK
ncbi:MAG TPA: hypothetical protein VF523_01445 [Burkholderiales bacterium]